MSKNIDTANLIADQIAAEQVAPVAPVEQSKVVPTADQVIEALLAQFAPDAQLTAYQIHVVANLAFEILDVRVLINGEEQVKQIAPQYVYNKTKSLRATKGSNARFDLDEAAQVISSIIGGTKSPTMSKDRIDTNALRAQALKALKG